jgi:hypothetical protein
MKAGMKKLTGPLGAVYQGRGAEASLPIIVS